MQKLIEIGYWRRQEAPDTTGLPWPEPGRLPEETRKLVAEHLMAGEEHAAWMGYSRCRLCGKRNGSTCLTDGEFVYPEGYAHYILDHGVNPDPRLLAKVLAEANQNQNPS